MSTTSKSLFSLFPLDWKKQVDVNQLRLILDGIERKLQSDIENELIVPQLHNIFKAFDLCTFDRFRVLILGQDPYPTPGYANGLAFSVAPSISPIPKSLTNIYKELEQEGYEVPENGDLSKWAAQGVLLLNSALTTNQGVTNAHANIGWEDFLVLIFEALSKKNNVVGMFWGKQAQVWSQKLNSTGGLNLTAPHPSPLSAYRGFFGCQHFTVTNEFLASKDLRKIQW